MTGGLRSLPGIASAPTTAPSILPSGGGTRVATRPGMAIISALVSLLMRQLSTIVQAMMSAVRKWEDTHVYAQPKEGRYFAVLDALAKACVRVDARVAREDVPRPMALASTIVQKDDARGGAPSLRAEPLR